MANLLRDKTPHHRLRAGRTLDKSDKWVVGLIVAIGLLLILSLAFLRRYPPAFVDEAWNTNRAWAWLKTGINAGTMDAGIWDQLDGFWHFYPLLPSAMLGAVIQVFGLSLVPLRLLSYLFGLLLLISVYTIVRLQAGTRLTGLLAVVLVACSWTFFFSSHLIRPDIWVAALGYAGMALVLVDLQVRPQVPVRSLLAGLMIVVGFEMHPNALIYVPIVGVICLSRAGRDIFRLRQLWTFVLGLCLGLAGYAWLHILPAPQTYLTISRGFGSGKLPPLLAGGYAILVSAGTTLSELLLLSGGRFLAVPAAAAALWGTQRRLIAAPVLWLLSGLLAFILLVSQRLDYYFIHLTPLCDIIIAFALEKILLSSGEAGFWQRRAKAWLVATTLASVLFTTYAVLASPAPDRIEETAQRISAVAPEDSVLMGSQTFWFGLQNHRYLSWEWVSYRQRLGDGGNLQEAMRAMHPDILIIDNHLRQFIHESAPEDEARISSFWMERWWSRQELDALLAARGHLLDTINTDAYGPVEVYSLTW